MSGCARLGDRTFGTCTAHKTPITVGGIIITASANVFADNIMVSRLGDVVQADCGHTGVIITASPTTYANEPPIARLGDLVGGGPYTATIITASPDVFQDS